MIVEIEPNPNCPAVDTRVFHDLEPPRRVACVRLEREAGTTAWYEVTGWTQTGAPCPAWLRKVDDSGEGVAWLLTGGDAGLRLRPASHPCVWQLDDPSQWGEPLLIIGDLADVSCEPVSDQET